MSQVDQPKPEMRDEYAFSAGTRGKYAERYAKGSNVIVLDPDGAAEFNTSEAVNRALSDQLRRRAAGDA